MVHSPDERPVPSRHGADLAASRRMASRVRLSIWGPCEPSPGQWQALGAALWQGDPLADAVAEWLVQAGMAQARPVLERAIEQGLAAVPEAPQVLRDFIEACEQVPAWVQPEQLARGARFIHSTGLHGMMVLRDAGLMAGYQASAINQALLMTGSLQKGAQRRVAETTSWWLDATATDGLSRHSKGFKTTLRVRIMHALVRLSLSRHPQWDAERLGLPINQVDMQATYLGFSVVYLLALRITGMVVTQADTQALMHLWRYIGWLMGVDDAFLYANEKDARVGLFHNVLSQAPPDESSQSLGRALMDEPLQRHYPPGQAWRGQFNKARHLSLTRLFVGREGMRNLGLPSASLWYPMATLLPHLCWSGLPRLLPGGAAWLAQHGRRRQVDYLAVMFGAQQPGVAAHAPPPAGTAAVAQASEQARPHAGARLANPGPVCTCTKA
jgi:ER-bound oxygenase mpaB/B'/Rubber oxygenase, catalytic domain